MCFQFKMQKYLTLFLCPLHTASSIAALLLSASFFSPQFSISVLTSTENSWRLNKTEMHFVWFLPDWELHIRNTGCFQPVQMIWIHQSCLNSLKVNSLPDSNAACFQPYLLTCRCTFYNLNKSAALIHVEKWHICFELWVIIMCSVLFVLY